LARRVPSLMHMQDAGGKRGGKFHKGGKPREEVAKGSRASLHHIAFADEVSKKRRNGNKTGCPA